MTDGRTDGRTEKQYKYNALCDMIRQTDREIDSIMLCFCLILTDRQRDNALFHSKKKKKKRGGGGGGSNSALFRSKKNGDMTMLLFDVI